MGVQCPTMALWDTACGYTFSVSVWLGNLLAVADDTNRPVLADRLTEVPLRVPLPPLSRTERLGQRAAADLLMYLPVTADLYDIFLLPLEF